MDTEQIRFALGADAEARQIVEQGLRAFNSAEIGPYQYQPFELYARDEQDTVLGGMFGMSGMGWLYIDYLWVDPAQRGLGLGSRLLAQAEQEALRRGCSGVFLYTYSFQAPAFYQRHGYQPMGQLSDCPPGRQRLYLKKQLPASAAL